MQCPGKWALVYYNVYIEIRTHDITAITGLVYVP